MIIEPAGKRGESYYKFSIGPIEYDYEHRGLLRRIMSNVLTKVMDDGDQTRNLALKGTMGAFENSLVFISTYLDVLKNFTNVTKYNR